MDKSQSRAIRNLAHRYFDPDARQHVKSAIRQFAMDGSLTAFVFSLSNVITHRDQLPILVEICKSLPDDLKESYRELCCVNIEGYSDLNQSETDPSSDNLSHSASCQIQSGKRLSLPDQFKTSTFRSIKSFKDAAWQSIIDEAGFREKNGIKDSPSDSGYENSFSHSNTPRETTSRQAGRIGQHHSPDTHDGAFHDLLPGLSQRDSADTLRRQKKITLHRRSGEQFGFNIRGGREYGTGLYVSSVDPESSADLSGLRVGDRIIRVNRENFRSILHAEAVDFISGVNSLHLTVVPLTGEVLTPEQTLSNTLRKIKLMPSLTIANPISPADIETELRAQAIETYPNSRIKYEREPIIHNVTADFDGYLGCSIRGGRDLGRSAVISHVDRFSPAYSAGLIAGDKIVSINGSEVADMEHMEIALLATSSRHLEIQVFHRASDSTLTREINHRPRHGPQEPLTDPTLTEPAASSLYDTGHSSNGPHSLTLADTNYNYSTLTLPRPKRITNLRESHKTSFDNCNRACELRESVHVYSSSNEIYMPSLVRSDSGALERSNKDCIAQAEVYGLHETDKISNTSMLHLKSLSSAVLSRSNGVEIDSSNSDSATLASHRSEQKGLTKPSHERAISYMTSADKSSRHKTSNTNDLNGNPVPKPARTPLFQKNPKYNGGTIRSNLQHQPVNQSKLSQTEHVKVNRNFDSPDRPAEVKTGGQQVEDDSLHEFGDKKRWVDTRGVYRDGVFEVLI